MGSHRHRHKSVILRLGYDMLGRHQIIIFIKVISDADLWFGDSLAVKLLSKDLKTPYPKNQTTRITGLACMVILELGSSWVKGLHGTYQK